MHQSSLILASLQDLRLFVPSPPRPLCFLRKRLFFRFFGRYRVSNNRFFSFRFLPCRLVLCWSLQSLNEKLNSIFDLVPDKKQDIVVAPVAPAGAIEAHKLATYDGNEAAANISYSVADTIFLYPITPVCLF